MKLKNRGGIIPTIFDLGEVLEFNLKDGGAVLYLVTLILIPILVVVLLPVTVLSLFCKENNENPPSH
jgi:hypothetical protein